MNPIKNNTQAIFAGLLAIAIIVLTSLSFGYKQTVSLHCTSVYAYNDSSTLDTRLVDTTIYLNLAGKKWQMPTCEGMTVYLLEDSTSIIYFHGNLDRVDIPSINGSGNIYCK